MNTLPVKRAGNDLHRAGGVVAPDTGTDAGEAAVAGGEECRVPAKQAFLGQRFGAAGGGVEHHVDDAFDIAIHRGQCADVDAKAACD